MDRPRYMIAPRYDVAVYHIKDLGMTGKIIPLPPRREAVLSKRDCEIIVVNSDGNFPEDILKIIKFLHLTGQIQATWVGFGDTV